MSGSSISRPKSPDPRRGSRSGVVSREERSAVLNLIASGSTIRAAAEQVVLSMRTVDRIIADAGGMPPHRQGRHPRNLSPRDREEIFVGIQRNESNRLIAARIGRAHSTIGRDINLNGGRERYRPFAAERRAEEQSRRPKPFKLDANEQLFDAVQAGLLQKWSPKQISGRLRADYPDNPEMWMSHETIYHSLYVQGRGALRKELAVCLRSGRARRRPHKRSTQARARIPNMINISERPAEANDRAVPGHWEGDLIMGTVASNSAIATLVERKTRFVMLIGLGSNHRAEHVRDCLIELINTLPEVLRRSLTWDQGIELAKHADITIATGLEIYFCDPHSPWQRGSNENTNGLLRQYLPKGTDLSIHTQADLDAIAKELNGRPRQTLGWMKPCELITQLVR